MPRSHLEDGFLRLWRMITKRPDPVQQFRFHPTRKWQLDFSWPDLKVAVEIEGGIFSNGGHNRGRHYTSDCEKYRALTMMDWSLLRYTTVDVRERPAQMIEEVCVLLDKKATT